MSSTYKGFRFPREIISHYVWLYHRFTLSFRDIELLMAERGVEVRTRRSVPGVQDSGPGTPAGCGARQADWAISGISTSVRQDRWGAEVFVAGGRSVRKRARHPDPK